MTTTPAPPPPAAPMETYGIEPSIYHRRRQILSVLCISLVVVVMAVSSLNVAIPSIVEGLGASSTETLWIVEAYALVFAGVLLPAGALGDRFGRKRMLITGLTIFATMALIAGLSGDATQLIAARAVMGIGAALIMPSTLSIVTNVFPPHERGKAIATWAGFAGAGGALGPLLSGLILKFWGREHWGAVFFVNIPLTLVLIYLVLRTVPESKAPEGHALDPIGAVLSVASLGLLVFGIIEAQNWGWTSARILGCFVGAIVAGVLFVMWESRQKQAMLEPALFRLRGFSMGTLTITTTFFGMFGMYLLLAMFFQFAQGHSPLDSSVRTLPAAACMVLIAPRSPIVARKLGMKNLVRVGMTMITIGFVGMATLDIDSSYLHVVVSLVVLASGMAITMAPTSATIVNSLPLSKAGVGSAVNDVSREVGGALGIAVLGSLLGTGYRSEMTTRVAAAGAAVPDAVKSVVTDSIQGAFGVAASKNTPAAAAQQLKAAAQASFGNAFHMPLWVTCGVMFVMMLVISSLIPNAITQGESHG